MAPIGLLLIHLSMSNLYSTFVWQTQAKSFLCCGLTRVCALCRLEQDTAPKDEEKDEKRRRRLSYGGMAPPPPEFFCPISHCLMTEPVTLLNTGITFNRTSMQAWMRTGAISLLTISFSWHPHSPCPYTVLVWVVAFQPHVPAAPKLTHWIHACTAYSFQTLIVWH